MLVYVRRIPGHQPVWGSMEGLRVTDSPREMRVWRWKYHAVAVAFRHYLSASSPAVPAADAADADCDIAAVVRPVVFASPSADSVALSCSISPRAL